MDWFYSVMTQLVYVPDLVVTPDMLLSKYFFSSNALGVVNQKKKD